MLSVSKKPEPLLDAPVSAYVITAEDIRRAGVWGANAVNGVINITTRSAHATGGAMAVPSPSCRPDQQAWASLFAQDEIALPYELRLTLGARIEHNPYAGSEWLPTARLARQLELSVSGQNLDGAHAEFGPIATRMQVPRTVALKRIWRR